MSVILNELVTRFEFESNMRRALVDIALSDHERVSDEVFCPFCGVPSAMVKTNGDGFYRCKGHCGARFFLMRKAAADND